MAQHVIELNDDNFNQTISNGVILVDFYADWCGPCRMISPMIEELASDLDGRVKVAKLDIESAQKTTSECDVTSIPTIILFKDGQEVDRIVGVTSKDALLQKISAVSPSLS